ncbi:MAG: ROK family protein [Bacillota bacterium]|nr:ROK family protein [Bacillota bacterium]
MKKYINQDDMRQVNSSDVFNLIRIQKSVTRKQIEGISGLSWGGVSNITSRLLDAGYIIETKRLDNTGTGRIPTCLEVNGKDNYVVGIDVNMTGINAVVSNLKNEVIKDFHYEADFANSSVLLDSIFNFTKEILSEFSDNKLLCIGIAMQGIVDSKNKASVFLPGCKDWVNVPLAEIMENRFNLPVYIDHDPNCILLGHGFDKEYENAVLLRIDKGIGMAAMINGEILTDSGLFEIEHITVNPKGELCKCGSKGCLSSYVSETGITERLGLSMGEIFNAALKKDKKALGIFDDLANYLGMAISNLVKIFNCDEILLCGEMMEYKDFFLAKLNSCVKTASSYNKPCKVSVIDVKDATFGAALMAIYNSVKSLNI